MAANPGQQGRMVRHAEPTDDGSGMRDVEPERSDELATSGVPRINEIIDVVPLEEVVAVLNQDDAMEYRPVTWLS